MLGNRRRGRLHAPGYSGDGPAPRTARPAPAAPRPGPVPLGAPFTHAEVFFKHDGTPGDAYPATPVSGGTLLHLALEFDDIDVARWLIERGADVNARAAINTDGLANAGSGHTPLFHTVVNLASGMGLFDDAKARLLLDHGADPNARATFPPEATFHNNAPAEPLHDVTPVGYARRHPDPRCVNAPASRRSLSEVGRSDPGFLTPVVSAPGFPFVRAASTQVRRRTLRFHQRFVPRDCCTHMERARTFSLKPARVRRQRTPALCH